MKGEATEIAELLSVVDCILTAQISTFDRGKVKAKGIQTIGVVFVVNVVATSQCHYSG